MALLLETVSDSKKAQDDLKKLQGSVENIQKSVDQTTKSFSTLAKTITTGVVLAFSGSAFTRISDTLLNIRTKIQLSVDSTDEFARALRDVRRVAIEANADLSGVANVYSKVARSTKDLGVSQKELVRFTTSVSKAISVSGANAQEASSAILQLGQALGSGTLQGEELRAVLESAAELAKQIAKGLGVGVGDLKKLGEAGELTTSKIFKALIKQGAEIDKLFESVNLTFEKATSTLKDSFLILFDEVQATLFGTKNAFNNFIKTIAINVLKIAENFSFTFTRIKIEVKEFVLSSVLLFYQFESTLIELKDSIENIFKDLFGSILPSLVLLTEKLLNSFQTLLSFTKQTFEKITNFIDLNKALEHIKNWATEAERWFFWLYDKVVGRSWIPDLISDITKWLSTLLEKPLQFITNFVKQANLKFSSLTVLVPFLAALKVISKYRKALLAILGVSAAVATTIGTLAFTDEKGITNLNIKERLKLVKEELKLRAFQVKDLSLNVSDKIKEIGKNSFDTVLNFFKKIYEFGVNIFNKIREPFQTKSVTQIAVDFLPEGSRVPILATLTGIFVLAITSAFKSDALKLAIFSLGTLLGSVLISKTVSQKEIVESVSGFIFGILDTLEKGITKIFDGSVLKDPLGLFLLLTKIALLFKSGRAFVGRAVAGVATAPTALAENLTSRLAAANLDRSLNNLGNELNRLQANSRQLSNSYARESRLRLTQLSQMRDASGNLIGIARATAAFRARDPAAFGTTQSAAAIRSLLNLQQTSRADQQQLRRAIDQNIRVGTETERQLGNLRNRLTEQADIVRRGLVTGAAGIGGTLGAVAGFQLGVDIAKGMTDAPGWQKVGVAIGTSMISQGIGAAIGSAIGFAILGVAAVIGRAIGAAFATAVALARFASLFINPFILGAALVGAAIYTGYKLFESLPDKWKEGIKGFFKGIFTAKPSQQAIQTQQQEIVSDIVFGGEFRDQLVKSLVEGISDSVKEILTDILKRIRDLLPQPVDPANIAPNRRSSGVVTPYVEPVPRFASGGFISGPGTGTSDSIPAMLSNGEFVVNAKSAAKNWKLLSVINSGKDVSYFRRGTETKSESISKLGNSLKNILFANEDILVDNFQNIFSDFFKLPKDPALRLLSAYRELMLFDNFYKTFKEANLSVFGITSETYSKLDPTAKEYVDSIYSTAQKRLLTTIAKKSAASTAISQVVAVSPMMFGKSYQRKFGLILSALFSADQIGLPILLGSLRGKRFYETDGALTTSNKLDSLLKTLEETPYIGKTESLSNLLIKNLSKTPDSLKNLPTLEDILIQERAKQGKFDPDGLSPLELPVPRKRKAMGGFISGPGTGTSDSIPAMLSNGEFVVNAKSAAKNWKLLSAINSGKNTSYFANGTNSTFFAEEPLQAPPTNFWEDLLKNFNDFFQPLIKFIRDKLPKSFETVSETMGLNEPKFEPFSKKYESESLDNFIGILSETLKKELKFPKVNFKELKELTPEALKNISLLVDKFKEADIAFQQIAKTKGPSSFGARLAQSIKDDALKQVAKTLNEFGVGFEPPAGVSAKKETTSLKIRDLFQTVRSAFPSLDISEDLFFKLDDELRAKLIDAAKVLTVRRNKILEEIAGSLEEPYTEKTAPKLQARFKELEDLSENLLKPLADSISNYKPPFERFRALFQEAGIELSREAFDLMIPSDRLMFVAFAKEKELLLRNLAKGENELNQEQRKIFAEALKNVNKKIEEFSKTFGKSSIGVLGVNLESIGISFSKNLLNLLTDAEVEIVNSLIQQAKSLKTEGVSETERIANQLKLDEIVENIRKIIESPRNQEIKEVGKLFGENIRSNFSTALSGALRGESEENKSILQTFAKRILDSTTNEIINTFIKGFMKGFKDSFLENATQDLGKGLFELGKGLFSSILGIFGGGSYGNFSGAMIAPGVGVLASGGLISGPGTGTSDSIPTMLSNGEFVINAKATKEHLSLLAAINSGRIAKLAEGGLISTSIINAPPMNLDKPSLTTLNKNQQVVNITITGDISRQTRAEIYNMLPVITNNVNKQNKEMNYRG